MKFVPEWCSVYCILTCLFRSSIIRAIWIFFLPIFATYWAFPLCHKRLFLWLLYSTFRSLVSLFNSKLLASAKKKKNERYSLRLKLSPPEKNASVTHSSPHTPAHRQQEEDRLVLGLCVAWRGGKSTFTQIFKQNKTITKPSQAETCMKLRFITKTGSWTDIVPLQNTELNRHSCKDRQHHYLFAYPLIHCGCIPLTHPASSGGLLYPQEEVKQVCMSECK